MIQQSKLFVLIFLIMTSSGCALFRKKNRCDDCPKWSKKSELKKENLVVFKF
jgi:hypothetical protein